MSTNGHTSPRQTFAAELRNLVDRLREDRHTATERARDAAHEHLAAIDRQIAATCSALIAIATEGADTIDAALEQRPKAHRPSARRSTP